MITPIGQRQVLQTVAAEAVRAAHEGNEQVQREIARRQVLDQRLAEDQGAVHQVSSTENLRLEENAQEQRRHGGRPGREELPEAEAVEGAGSPAGPADSHLDLLA